MDLDILKLSGAGTQLPVGSNSRSRIGFVPSIFENAAGPRGSRFLRRFRKPLPNWVRSVNLAASSSKLEARSSTETQCRRNAATGWLQFPLPNWVRFGNLRKRRGTRRLPVPPSFRKPLPNWVRSVNLAAWSSKLEARSSPETHCCPNAATGWLQFPLPNWVRSVNLRKRLGTPRLPVPPSFRKPLPNWVRSVNLAPRHIMSQNA